MIAFTVHGTSSASIQRGRLKHSWLENEVLNKSPDTVVELRRGAGWPELERFPIDANRALTLADDVEHGFSPAHLVAACIPLASLSSEERKTITDAVHQCYLERFDALNVAIALRVVAQDMAKALNDMLEEWRKPDDTCSDVLLIARWYTVLSTAERLRLALDSLPRGVVLP